MSEIKIVYKELPKKVVMKPKIEKITNDYEELKKSIFEKSKKPEYKNVKVTEKEKFILEIENYELPGLEKIWDETTYKYFYDNILEKPGKLTLNIVKVDNYPPKWEPPQKSNILEEPLNPAPVSESSLSESGSYINEFQKKSSKALTEGPKATSTKVRIFYKDLQKKVVQTFNLPDNKFAKYEDLKNTIFEKSKKTDYKSVKVTEKDKFVLEIEDYDISGLEKIWDENTYKFFYRIILEKLPDKVKLNIVKVTKYPEGWKPPQFYTILENTLKTEWESTKEDIEKNLNEKFLEEGKKSFIQEKKKEKNSKKTEIDEDYISDIHVDVICNNCLTLNFIGSRYICSECNNFNLCEYCYEKAHFSHKPGHIFIKVNKPISTDSHKYNSIFSPNKILLKKPYEPFEVDIEVINNGVESLAGCFLSPIRFGKNYLGCLKATITDDCDNGDKVALNPLFKFEDENDSQPKDEYEGYFRLFTEEGIPFGDIIYLQVLIEN